MVRWCKRSKTKVGEKPHVFSPTKLRKRDFQVILKNILYFT